MASERVKIPKLEYFIKSKVLLLPMSRFKQLRKHLSFPESLKIYLKIKKGDYNNWQVSHLIHPVNLRKNNFYDYATFDEVILKKSYELNLDFTPVNIIDGGGNIGLTAAYFASKYPAASIVTVEPDPGNFHILLQNTKHYSNILAFQKGLWTREANLLIRDAGLGNNAFMVEETDQVPNSIPATGISDIMEMMKWGHIDILKLDVEGSEKEIFSSGYEQWLPKTRVLIVEIHDRMKKGCSKSVFNAINNYNFSFAIAGENLVFMNEDLK
jgi:FkbM family methyltransferase